MSNFVSGSTKAGTLVLYHVPLTSAAGAVLAYRAIALWVPAIIGSATFVALHMREWFHLINVEHLTLTSNPWGSPLFGAVFFGVTGLHITHVIIGVIYMAIVATGFGRGKFSAEDVEVNGLYWHFVDLVWMFVFPLVYIMSVTPK